MIVRSRLEKHTVYAVFPVHSSCTRLLRSDISGGRPSAEYQRRFAFKYTVTPIVPTWPKRFNAPRRKSCSSFCSSCFCFSRLDRFPRGRTAEDGATTPVADWDSLSLCWWFCCYSVESDTKSPSSYRAASRRDQPNGVCKEIPA